MRSPSFLPRHPPRVFCFDVPSGRLHSAQGSAPDLRALHPPCYHMATSRSPAYRAGATPPSANCTTFRLDSHASMSNRPASWRTPPAKQMDKMAAEAAVGRNASAARPTDPADPMPAEYWDAVLKDARTDDRPPNPSIRPQRLSQIARHLLRVTCTRCSRIVEIQKVDVCPALRSGRRLEGRRSTTARQHLPAADGPPRGRRLLAGLRLIAGSWRPSIIRPRSPEATERRCGRNSARRGR